MLRPHTFPPLINLPYRRVNPWRTGILLRTSPYLNMQKKLEFFHVFSNNSVKVFILDQIFLERFTFRKIGVKAPCPKQAKCETDL